MAASNNSRSKQEEEQDGNETRPHLGISLNNLRLFRKKKLLVLPLAGIIVHRVHLSRPNTIPKNRRPDFSYRDFLVFKRPYCEEFLKFCFERFEVGLWSSAWESSIQTVLEHVVGELKSKFLFTWDQGQCTRTGFMCLDRNDKPLFLKELKYVWENSRGEYSSSNTLLITDPVKALLNPPNTAIFPNAWYDVENDDDDFLGPDGELRTFLDGVAKAEDVQTYLKDHPFGEPAITPSHTDWDYYSKIISFFSKKHTI